MAAGDFMRRRIKAPPPTEDLIRELSTFDLSVGELALALREMILEEAPGSIEKLSRGYALVFWYSLTGLMSSAFVLIVIYPKAVNLMFNRGAELSDPDRVLVGEGKIIRHIKVRRPVDLKNPNLRKFIRAALKHAKMISREKELISKSKRSKRPEQRRRVGT